MKLHPGFHFALILILMLISGCNLTPSPPATISTLDVAAISTNAMETISVKLTQEALNQLLNAPSITSEPKAADLDETTVPTLTNTPEPEALPPTETPPPTEIPPTQTMEPTQEPPGPILYVTEDTNCRAGPSPMYAVEGYITPEMRLTVAGINVGHSWWWVENPTYPGYHCWVWKYTAVVEGDVSTLPVYLDPWTPTPGTPEVSVSITRWTGDQKVQCPVKVSFAGAIRTNQGGQFRYQWVKKGGLVIEQGWVTIAADGLAYISTSIYVKQSVNGSMQLRIVYPVKVYSDRVEYSVTCTK